MRQSNKCGSVRNEEIFNLHLRSGAIPLPPAKHQPHLLIPSAQKINQKKAKNQEMRFNSEKLYCTALAYLHKTQS